MTKLQSTPTFQQRIAAVASRIEQLNDTVANHATTPVIVWPARRKVAEPKPAEIPSAAEILADIPFPVVVLNSAGQVVHWSKSAEESFGWYATETLGRPPAHLPSDRFGEHARLFLQAESGVDVTDAALICRTRDGRRITHHVSMRRGANGCVVCTYRAEPRQAPVTVANEDGRSGHERSLELIGRISSGVFHDLNNLFAVMGGHSELLVDQLSAESETRQALHVILAALRHANGLIRRVHHFARPGSNDLEILDLGEVVQNTLPLVRVVAGRLVDCVATTVDEIPVVRAIRGDVERIILNLVANARDALPAGGAIAIRTASITVRPNRNGWPADRPRGPYVQLTVLDNGTGMDQQTLARIFDPFFTTKGDNGTGIGLAAVREIVDRHRGHIEVESQPGQGTEFRIFLPAALQPEDEIPDSLAGPSIAAEPPTALLVDDDELVRSLTKSSLEAIGYNVIEAASGDEAIRLARLVTEPIDLLVTDSVMPGIGGRCLAERLRCTRPGLPVVHVSGFFQPGLELDPGTAFLAKPFTRMELIQTIQSVAQTVPAD